MKKIALGAAMAVAVLGLTAGPVSAGATFSGEVVITPDPVEQGGSVTITNAEGAGCESYTPVAVPTYPGQVYIEIHDPNEETIVSETVEPDEDGNWSYEVTDLETLGEYTVFAECERTDNIDSAVPALAPPFEYVTGTFEVIAQATTTTTAAPSTTTTAAATAAVTAAPAYTG